MNTKNTDRNGRNKLNKHTLNVQRTPKITLEYRLVSMEISNALPFLNNLPYFPILPTIPSLWEKSKPPF